MMLHTGKFITGRLFTRGVQRRAFVKFPTNPPKPPKEPIRVIETSTPGIYTTTELNPTYDLSKSGASAKSLFSLHPSYVHPEEMDYNLPTQGKPEFAFVGRSNVGKSSLIDSLMGNRKIVRVSKEPGCTRSINYYGLSKEKDSKKYAAYFVDLPGYGFAKKSKEEQQKWTQMIHDYISNRNQSVLRFVVHVPFVMST